MTSAAAVSARLHRLGFTVLGSGTSRMREGIRVSGSVLGHVTVSVDLDGPRAAARLADDIVDALTSDGVDVVRVDEARIRVTG